MQTHPFGSDGKHALHATATARFPCFDAINHSPSSSLVPSIPSSHSNGSPIGPIGPIGTITWAGPAGSMPPISSMVTTNPSQQPSPQANVNQGIFATISRFFHSRLQDPDQIGPQVCKAAFLHVEISIDDVFLHKFQTSTSQQQHDKKKKREPTPTKLVNVAIFGIGDSHLSPPGTSFDQMHALACERRMNLFLHIVQESLNYNKSSLQPIRGVAITRINAERLLLYGDDIYTRVGAHLQKHSKQCTIHLSEDKKKLSIEFVACE